MHCPNCGFELKPNQKFCTRCGFDVSQFTIEKPVEEVAPTQPTQQQVPPVQQQVPPVSPVAPQAQFTQAQQQAPVAPVQTRTGVNAAQGVASGLAMNTMIHQKNQRLWLVGAFASLVQLFAIFKLPIIDLSQIIKNVSSGVSGVLDLFGGLSEELSGMSGVGDAVDKIVGGSAEAMKFPLMSVGGSMQKALGTNDGSTMFDLMAKTVLILAIVVIVMTFVRKFTNIVFIVAGGLTTIVYGVLYYGLNKGIEEMTSQLGDIPLDVNFIGNGMYVGIFAALVVLGIGIFNLVTTKRP